MRYTIKIFAWMILVLLTAEPVIWARTLEKREEADPVLRLKQEHENARAKVSSEIDALKTEIEALKSEIRKLDGRINKVKNSGSMNRSVLDDLFEVVAKKEGLQKELKEREKDLSEKVEDLHEEDAKRKEAIEALKATLKKDERKQRAAALKQDIRKYERIINSSSVRKMDVDDSAWRALAIKYPEEAEGVRSGDVEELEFRVKYGGMTNSVGIRFVLIPAGTFRMGSPDTELSRSSDESRHKVIIKKSYYLQTTEVTQGQWFKLMGKNPSEFDKCGKDCPVENVSWEDCQKFIGKLNELEKTDKYRLPTEAEWEYACRGGRTSAFANGDITVSGCGMDPGLDEMGWYCGNSRRKTHPIGLKKLNVWGLYDMHGNVWEWCQDWYGPYPAGQVVDPQGRSYGPNRVIRGGSCLNFAEKCRSAYRYSYRPYIKMNNIGFRIARTK